MKKLLILLVLAGMLIGVGCEEKREHTTKTTVYTNTYEERRKPAADAKAKKDFYMVLYEQQETEKRRRAVVRRMKAELNTFRIGQTTTVVRRNMGSPDDINRSVGRWGVHEQWVYGNKYLYFENGILTSWQD